MFRIKYAGIHNINQHYFESDMQAGIDYDFLLFFIRHTSLAQIKTKQQNTLLIRWYIYRNIRLTITVLLKIP